MTRLALGLGLTLLVAACDRPIPGEARYRVISHDAEIRAATLTLCDEQTEMTSSGAVWTADVRPTCEGGGQIVVQLADGAAVTCSGDNVTPGMGGETLGYVASSTGCAFAE